jgi:hypothetical protein
MKALNLDPYYLKYNGGESYSIKKTEYGKEFHLNHISREYLPNNEEQSLYEKAKDGILKNDKTFIQYLKHNNVCFNGR